MKLLPVLLGVSLAANAALVVVNRPGSAAASSRPGETRAAGGAESGSIQGTFPKSSVPATGEGKAIAAAIKRGDLDGLRDELLAAGLDEPTVREIVRARIQKRYEERFKALQPKTDPKQNWWKNEDRYGSQTKEQRAAMKALQAEMKAEFTRVLGEDPMAEAMRNNPWMERQYGFISPEKREALQQMEQDYNELGQELSQEANGFRMPADAEKARFLEEEKRRDLASILSPEEMADYERRRSRTAGNLRWRMSQMDATEQEYVAVFELQREFDERYGNVDFNGNAYTDRSNPEQRKARGDAENAMKAQIKDALGPDRYKTYVRSQDHDYQQLANATKRFNLPADTPARIYDLRDEVPQVALRIADDVNLTPEQKKTELKKLADETRDRVSGALGPDVAQVYLQNNGGMQWLNQLEQGTIITFDENGGQQHRRIEQPPKKPAPPKAK